VPEDRLGDAIEHAWLVPALDEQTRDSSHLAENDKRAGAQLVAEAMPLAASVA
jgi:hypothetical protein